MEKRGAISHLFHNILLPVVRIPCSKHVGTIFLLRDMLLFKISEFEITSVDCILCVYVHFCNAKAFVCIVPPAIMYL